MHVCILQYSKSLKSDWWWWWFLLPVTNNRDYLASNSFSFYYLLSFDKLQEEEMIFELELTGDFFLFIILFNLTGDFVVSYSHKINV